MKKQMIKILTLGACVFVGSSQITVAGKKTAIERAKIAKKAAKTKAMRSELRTALNDRNNALLCARNDIISCENARNTELHNASRDRICKEQKMRELIKRKCVSQKQMTKNLSQIEGLYKNEEIRINEKYDTQIREINASYDRIDEDYEHKIEEIRRKFGQQNPIPLQ